MLSVLALAAVAAIYSAALAALRRVDRPQPAWWFGYSRDGVNLMAVLLFSGAFLLASLPGHLALLAGAGLALGIYGLDYLFARALALPRAALLHGVTTVSLAAAVGLAARPLEHGLTALLEGLF
jgi:hypothetical protein